jgi:hypothetical protein
VASLLGVNEALDQEVRRVLLEGMARFKEH